MSNANYLQVGPGGICFAHGPYEGQYCPRYQEWLRSKPPAGCPCVHDPRNPEYVAMFDEQVKQTAKVYTQAALDKLVEAERERCAVIAETHYVDHRATNAEGLIHDGQCHQAIAAAIRKGNKS